MNAFERLAIALRRGLPVPADHALWRTVRPLYRHLLSTLGRDGLLRSINGTDQIRLVPELYTVGETYEPDVWRALMGEVRVGDTVVDVGAAIGLYTLSLAARVGPSGRVVAFEPDPDTARLLTRNIALNRVQDRVVLHTVALGDRCGKAAFAGGAGLESHVASQPHATGVVEVAMTTLDDVFSAGRIDILKLDVEGYEERVLRGARQLLSDPNRAPRVLFIEVHPYAWGALGATSEGLLDLLDSRGYQVVDLSGARVQRIDRYGEVLARRRGTASQPADGSSESENDP